ncbi:sensor histidine kinase [Sorangium cellulosum So ce56]|uniref:histidine kinase n=2 Tax=Sorangium cellulosum TaxID=56 RepID=A9GME4_SORC5|nr:sensor histidine kinase [Sorangium cellulosum So ce56]
MSARSREGRRTMGLTLRLCLMVLVPIVLAVALYGAAIHTTRHQFLRSQAAAELRHHASLVEAAIGGAVERGQVELLKRRIERLAQADRILGIAAFDARGGPILVTDPIAGEAAELAALARRALATGAEIEEERTLGGAPALVRTVTFSQRGLSVVAVVVRDLRYLDAFARSSNHGLALAGAALLAAAALSTAFASRATVGRPAGAIVAGVERVARGELGTTVPEAGAEELRRLARAFNAMTASLAEARARLEQEQAARAAVERKLQQAHALSAVGQVVASIGHEIGSPLNVILARARRLADQPGWPEAARGELETIATQSERISRVVARLLSIARPPRSLGRGSDVAQVAREVLAFLGPECRQRGITTRIDHDGAPLHVALDADHLFQVLFNLCLNAAQAQPHGGAIAVRLARTDARKASIEVEDRGPGVPPDVAEHIFEAFFTSRGDRGGTGLGLAIVEGIVREAGGSVELVRTGRGGACFRATLPSGAAAPLGARAVEARA